MLFIMTLYFVFYIVCLTRLIIRVLIKKMLRLQTVCEHVFLAGSNLIFYVQCIQMLHKKMQLRINSHPLIFMYMHEVDTTDHTVYG